MFASNDYLMIIFYTQVNKVKQLELGCDQSCAVNCLKPKSKCCNKYKKKGVNCKRCPHILLQQAS